MNARELFPNLANAERTASTPWLREQTTEALDLIDKQAREIARLNAALMGENDTGR